ncbi:MAG: hypothetical protein JNL97_03800 [Verrucomicrobiales bacterium]|nr:hypothetical protein [Verrucomicrobiales bacterium]
MKTLLTSLVLTCTALAAHAVVGPPEDWFVGFQEGAPELRSAGKLAFGPSGILFVADTKAAAVVAIATGDTKPSSGERVLKVEAIDAKVAALLGTAVDEILIEDMAVNPISRQVYLAVSRGRGPAARAALVRVGADGTPALVGLEKVAFSRAVLPDAPTDAPPKEGQRGSNPRLESITDIAFLEDRVLIAGLSNEEFASTLRAIPFPFKTVAGGASVEIYHGAHGRFETRSPIRTFVPFNVGNRPHLLAAYTCTPLVQFPLEDVKPGAKIKGKTIAELGNRNRPLDMIVYEKNGKEYLLLANSSRGVMKVATDKIEQAESIGEPVKDGATRGLAYETVAGWTGVDQLDRLDADRALVLRKTEAGVVNLESLALP